MRDEIIQVPSGPYALSVRVAGQGPLAILMHGWPELAISWRHQIGPLAEAGFTVAAPDMRGYGGSSKAAQTSAYEIDAMADDMAAIADALGHERWVSIGHDWGSPVAWRTALARSTASGSTSPIFARRSCCRGRATGSSRNGPTRRTPPCWRSWPRSGRG